MQHGLWTCPFCGTRNQLPALPTLADALGAGADEKIAEDAAQIPFPLDPRAQDIEYVVAPPEIQKPAVFLYVVDTCFEEPEEMQALKDAIAQSISALPADCLVGLIGFGRHVQVYQVGAADCQTSYTFNGARRYSQPEVARRLGLMGTAGAGFRAGAGGSAGAGAGAQFIQQRTACEFSLSALIEQMRPDAFPTDKYARRLTSTGCAVDVAQKMLAQICPHTGARILLFCAGPCTQGPGLIVDPPLKDPIRSHHDIRDDSHAAKRYRDSRHFYGEVAESAAANGHTVDIFIGCYDQVGLSEMEPLPDKTGGVVVQSDSFTSAIFKRSFQKLLGSESNGGESSGDGSPGAMQFGLNATLQCRVTSNLRIRGAVGHLASLHHRGPDTTGTGNQTSGIAGGSAGPKNSSAKNTGVLSAASALFHHASSGVGVSGTDAWKLGCVWAHSTYAFFFEVADADAQTGAQAGPVAQSSPGFATRASAVQFITTYQHPDGSRRIHVTTAQRPTAPAGSADLINNFDQEAAAVILARQAVWESVDQEKYGPADGVRAVDERLIALCAHFASYRTGDSSSFALPAQINLFPQFCYHLRRSSFIQVFNSSPDETSYCRHCLLAEDCTNGLIMIQPTLTAYQVGKDPEPVVLDSTSLKPDRILLLDTFFHILIYHGSVVAEWRRQRYQDQPDYSYLKDFLAQPRLEAADILVDRFPLPRFIDTEEGGSQARFLISRLSPTTSYRNVDSMMNLATRGAGAGDGESGAVIMTDDVSLITFMEYVKKAVVGK